VQSPFLEVLKNYGDVALRDTVSGHDGNCLIVGLDDPSRLDVALGSLVWWLATLHIAGGLRLDDLYGPFQPRLFYDSVIL